MIMFNLSKMISNKNFYVEQGVKHAVVASFMFSNFYMIIESWKIQDFKPICIF